MGAEIEILDAVGDGDFAPVVAPRGPLERARALAANPRLQGAAAATAGMLVGAATMGLMRRLGNQTAPAAPPHAVPVPVPLPVPMLSGTWVVRVRVGGPPATGGPGPGPGAGRVPGPR